MNSLYARAWYSKALALLSLKNQIGSEKSFEKALEAFNAVLEVNPENSVAWQYKGNIFLYLDQPEEALEAFEKSLDFDPDNIHSRYFKGFTFGYLNMPEQALREFGDVLERNAEHPGALYYSGLVFNQLSKHEEALKVFTKVAELYPENLRALYYRGVVLSALERNEEALEAYEKVLMLEPSHVGALEEKAKAYFSLDKMKEALISCNKALELEPSSAEAWEIKGNILESMEKKEEALEAFEKSLILEPGNLKNRIKKGKLLGCLENYYGAFEIFASSLQLDSSLIEAEIGKGKALLALGNYQESLDSFTKVLESDSESLEAWSGTGTCLLGMQRYYEAIKAYEKTSFIGSENSCDISGLGEVYYELGNYSKALEAFKQALVLDPENIFAWNGKGNSLCKLGKYTEALNAYETLLSLDYESLSARYNRAVALSKLKCHKKEFEESLKNQPQTAFKKYLELSGNIPEEKIENRSWKYRGLAFSGIGEYKEALEAFEKAINTESQVFSPLIYKGIILLFLKRWEEALEISQKAEEAIYASIKTERPGKEKNGIEKNEKGNSRFSNSEEKKSQLETLKNVKGFSLYALGRYEDALRAFESARKLSENGTVACSGEGLIFSRLEEWGKAVKAFDKVLVFDPENTQVSVMKAFAHIRLGEFEKAISILDTLSIDNKSDISFCLLGFACSKLEDFKKSLEAYRSAIKLNPKNVYARNGLAEIYFKLGNNRGALKELEPLISGDPENAFSICLKGRIELEEQAFEDILESFRRVLSLDTEDQKLLLWDAYARYMYAEVSFDEGSARFRNMLLATAGKLERAGIYQKTENRELKAYTLYFLGLVYFRAGYFKRAARKLEECLEIKDSAEIRKSASLLLKNIRTGPLKPSWWEWWLDTRTNSTLKKTGFGLIIFLLIVLLLSHPAASTLPFISWPSSFINQIFSLTHTVNLSWASYGKEYSTLIVFLLSVLFFPEFNAVSQENEDLEFEPISPPAVNFDIPASILEEFTEILEENLLSLEPMEESIRRLVRF